MSDDTFNLSMRKFLKTVGVTSQQAIEEAVRKALAEDTLPSGPLTARVQLSVDGLDLSHEVTGDIALDDA